MLDKKRTIIKANNLMYKCSSHTLTKLESELEYLLKEDKDPKLYITLAKVYFENKKYREALITYLEVLSFNNSQSIYLGLFKTYTALGEYYNANYMLKRYKFTRGNNPVEFVSEFLDSALIAINTNLDEIIEVKNKEKYMYHNFDGELKEKYGELVDYYNSGNYSKSIEITKEIQSIVEEKNICVEFNTLINLLMALSNLKRKKFSDNKKEILKEMIEKEDYDNLLYIVKIIVNGLFSVDKTLKKAFRVLVLNGYANECHEILDNIVKVTSIKDEIKYLNKLVNEYEEYYNLSNELKDVYKEALLRGSYYRKQEYYEEAYDVYTWAYYLTSCNIFNYYLGKILYLSGNVEEANKYFNLYLKNGVEKEWQVKDKLPKKKQKRSYIKDESIDIHKFKMQKKLKNEQFFDCE